MPTTANTITVRVPYALRHLIVKIEARGGRFDPAAKSWSLPDTKANRDLANQLAPPPPQPEATPEERVRTVARVAADLLTRLNQGRFVLRETTAHRVVIEKAPAA